MENERGGVVVGREPPAPELGGARRRRPAMQALVATMALALAALVAFQEAPKPAPELPGLEAPADPARPPAEGNAATSTIPAVATGWQRLDLPGTGPVVGMTHGDAGWMAVAGGDVPQVITSPDARVWLARTFPGPLDGVVSTLVSGSRMVVVNSDPWNGGARSWLSTDGGVGWETALVPSRWAIVAGLSDGEAGLLAAGYAGADATSVFDPGAELEAVVWRYGDGSWEPLEFAEPPGPHSRIEAVADLPSGAMFFGRAHGQPAAWRIDGSSLAAVSLAVPPEVGGWGFLAVAPRVDGLWIAEMGAGSVSRYLVSSDGSRWALVDSPESIRSGGPAVSTSLGVIQVSGDDQFYRLISGAGVQYVRFRYPDVATGFDANRSTTAVASDGERIVMAGGGEGQPVIWVRGAGGGGVGVTAPPATTGRWRTVQSFGVGWWDRDPWLFQVAASGDGLLVSTPQGVWRTSDLSGAGPAREPKMDPGRFVSTNQGLFLLDARGRLLREAAGSWVAEDAPAHLEGLTGNDAGLLGYGWDDEGSPLVVRKGDAGWEAVQTDPERTIQPIAAAGGRLFGVDSSDVAATDLFTSDDGVTWARLASSDSFLGAGLFEGGDAFFVQDVGPHGSTISMLDDATTLRIPSIAPRQVVRIGSVARVLGTDGLWQSHDGGETWTALPFGFEYGLTGPIRLAPTESPVVLMADRDAYRIMTFTR